MVCLANRPRATRYQMAAQVNYRRAGDESWADGRTVDISRTGVLLRAGGPAFPVGTAMELVLLLPSLGHPGRSQVRCRGRIARHAAQPEGEGCAMAVTIETYDFLGIAPDGAPGEVVT